MAATRGSELLTATRATARAIGTACAVDERSARSWLRGQKQPSANAQQALLLAYHVPVASWVQKPHGATSAAPAQPPAAAPATSSEAPAAGVAGDVEAAQAAVRALQAELGAAAAVLDLTARVRMADQLSGALARLAKLTGPLALTPKQLVESSAWQHCQSVILEAIRPHPLALADASDALCGPVQNADASLHAHKAADLRARFPKLVEAVEAAELALREALKPAAAAH